MQRAVNPICEKGYIALARPLAPGVARVNLNDPTFSDLAGVLTGVKPVTYTDCADEDAPRFKDMCARLSLKFLSTEEFLGKRWFHVMPGKKVFLLSRDAATLKAAASAWKDPENNERWAGMLGYPECCILMYAKWLRTLGRAADLVQMSFQNTVKKEKLDFKLNNVSNYSSRVTSSDPADRRSYDAFSQFNKGRNFSSMHVIGWHACAYDCPESLKKAGIIFSFIKHHAPDYAAGLEAALAKPVLFWDKYKYAFVDGRAAGGTVKYAAVSYPRSLLSGKLYREIAACDEIKIGRAKTEFRRKGLLVRTSASFRPLVLNFVNPEKPSALPAK